MSGGFDVFLKTRAARPGVVACAIRPPTGPILFRRYGDTLATGQVEQAMKSLAEAAAALQAHAKDGTLCWTFDYARIHFTRRADGAQMAVFSQYNPGQPPNQGALQLLAEFRGQADAQG
jgi:hypothetical protein